MRYFLTGGAGFLGIHLVKRLLQGKKHSVTVFDRRRPRFQENKHRLLRVIQGDLLNPKSLSRAIRGSDFVFHLAANSDLMRSIEDPAIDFRDGIHATFHLLEAMRKQSIRKLVYFSGSGVYGDFKDRRLPEDTGPLKPVSMYGASKLAGEALVSAYSHLYGIRAWIFRPANLVGAFPTHGVIYDFIRRLKANPNVLKVLGNGWQSKSYLHIDDFLEAVFWAVRRSHGPVEQFNVASETCVTVRTIARIVIRKMGLTKVKILFGKEKVGWKGDVPVVRLDIQKIKALGWKPRFDSRQAVIQTVQEILQTNPSPFPLSPVRRRTDPPIFARKGRGMGEGED